LPENSLDSWSFEIMHVEKWWKQSSADWTMVDYADRQEYMFLQTADLEPEDSGEEWKGPGSNAD
jgi:hypothetical protein